MLRGLFKKNASLFYGLNDIFPLLRALPLTVHGLTFLFWPNGSDGTKFGQCFFIGLDLRDSFSRSLLGENGYFIVFWHFRPSFKLILHTSKWILCKQKFWELFISILGSLQHKFYGHLDCLNRKFIGGVTFTPPRACPINRDPGLNRVNWPQ